MRSIDEPKDFSGAQSIVKEVWCKEAPESSDELIAVPQREHNAHVSLIKHSPIAEKYLWNKFTR